MGLVLLGIGAIFSIVGLICNIIVLIHAFKESVSQGFLCLCVPCHILMIIGGALGGNILGNVLSQVGANMC